MSERMDSSRRVFLKTTVAGAAATYFSGTLLGAEGQPGGPPQAPVNPSDVKDAAASIAALATPETTREGDMFFRTLGKTGEKVSLLGVGGFHMGVPEEEVGVRIVRRAVDAGVNFMDNCWDYHDGKSETRMGKALQDGYRKKVFLMSKIDGQTKASAAKQIEESLKRLQTDVIDLMQIHEVIRLEDPDRAFAKEGSIEALVAAQKAGKIRFIGFTGHKDPVVHLRMLDTAAHNNFRFDTVQMPINVLDAHFRSFTQQVLPLLVKENIGVLGMKPLASGHIFKSGVNVTAQECLHYAMTLPTSVVITGIESDKILDQALEAAKSYKPLTKEQVAGLLGKTREVALNGQHEKFKTDRIFDGTAKHPEWLGG